MSKNDMNCGVISILMRLKMLKVPKCIFCVNCNMVHIFTKCVAHTVNSN